MKKREELTVEKLREMTGLTLTDEEAEEMLRSIKQLAKAFVAVTFREESKDGKIDLEEDFPVK